VLIQMFGHPGNPNINAPKGVTHAEPDLMPGEDAKTNPNVPTPIHLEGVGLEHSLDGKEDDHSLEVEEEGIARESTSVEKDMGPCLELQAPRFCPLAMQEDVRSSLSLSSSSPSSPSLTTPEAASMQCSLVINAGTLETPEPNLDEEDEWEAFYTKTWGMEDEDTLNQAKLDSQPVKEEEAQDTNLEAIALAPSKSENHSMDWDPLPHDPPLLDGAAKSPTHHLPEQIRAYTKAGG
jgi:hypothetical protein